MEIERRSFHVEEGVVTSINRQLELIHQKLETLTALDVRQQQAIETIYEIKGDLKSLNEKYEELSKDVIKDVANTNTNSKLIWIILSSLVAGGGAVVSLTDFI